MDFAITDLAAYFTGLWQFSRDIVATDGKPIGRAGGTVEFTLSGHDLVYHETGELCLPGHTGPVTRTLLYHYDGARAAVHFDHGGFFHEVDLSTGHWHTDHPCRDDHYRGEYRLIDTDHWCQQWVVIGPDKDHVIATQFDRIRVEAAGCSLGRSRTTRRPQRDPASVHTAPTSLVRSGAPRR